VGADHVAHFGQPSVGGLLEGDEEAGHLVAGQAVEDPGPRLAGLDEAGPPEDLEVGGGVAHLHPGQFGEFLDAALALARSLWRSLAERILTLPDDLPVYPTHGAGSFCSAPAGGERTTTIGREKRTNPLLGAPDEDAFVAQLLAGLGSYPRYFARLREVNRRGPRLYGPEPPTLPPLGPGEVRRLLAGGALLVDARPVPDFAAGHVPGALSIPLRAVFGTWLGWLAEPDQPLVFVLDHDQDRADLVRQARKVGFEHLAGELAGGVRAWQAAGLPVAAIPLVEPAGVDPATTVDVRQASEFAAGHIPGAVHLELGALPEIPGELPGGPLTLACGHGERAMTAASLLAATGRGDVSVLVGGPDDWASATGRTLQR
jgi:rhodanese-related sulfurtransferase